MSENRRLVISLRAIARNQPYASDRKVLNRAAEVIEGMPNAEAIAQATAKAQDLVDWLDENPANPILLRHYHPEECRELVRRLEGQ
jgi:hypothetical protein